MIDNNVCEYFPSTSVCIIINYIEIKIMLFDLLKLWLIPITEKLFLRIVFIYTYRLSRDWQWFIRYEFLFDSY